MCGGAEPLSAVEIKQLRERLGLKPRQMARVLRMAPLSIARWESGASAPVGLSSEVLLGLRLATEKLDDEACRHMGQRLRLGVGSLLQDYLIEKIERSAQALGRPLDGEVKKL